MQQVAFMKCEWVRENIVLQVYGELADDARHELEQHVARCADCAAELKAEQDFHALLAARSRGRAVAEPGGVLAHAPAGSAGDGQAGQLLQPAGIRSGELAAADEVLAGAGIGDSDSGICGRSWRDVQDVWVARHDRPRSDYNRPDTDSHRGLHRRHQFHRARSQAPIRSASSTTPYRPRKHRDR